MRTGLLTSLAALALASCATNAIRLDRAATMSEAGRKAGDATLAFADRAMAANRDALIDIVAFDPVCEIPVPLIKSGRQVKGASPLCGPSATTATTPFPFARQTRRDLAVTAAVVDGITAYLDAVDEVLAKDDIDIVGSFANAQGDLQALQTIFGHDKQLLGDDQSAAITSVLTLLQEIASESAKVDDLRLLEAQILRDNRPVAFPDSACAKLNSENPPAAVSAFDNGICGLKLANKRWKVTFEAAQKSRFTLSNQIYRNYPQPEFDQRRTSVKSQVELYELGEAAPQLENALDNLADKFRAAHMAYLELLPGGSKAELTPKEKAKRARLERERVRSALRAVAELVKAF